MSKNLVLSQEQITDICKDIGGQLTDIFKHQKKLPVIVGVMKGSMNFMMDLVKYIECPVYTDYIQIKSYAGTSTTGQIQLIKDLSFDCKDRVVVIVEDVIDTGYSMEYLIKHINNHEPKKVYVCALFNKKNARKVDVKVDFIGCELEKNDFLVGYGLDYNEVGRNLPYVYAATPEDVEELKRIVAEDK